MNKINIVNLRYYYDNSDGEWVFDNFNLSAGYGESILIIGDNGIGKSTLGKLICGLMAPVEGSIIINSEKIYEIKGRKRIQLAYYVFQLNQQQFVSNTLKTEIAFAEKLCNGKHSIELYEKLNLPFNLDSNPFDLDVNQAWRFSLYLSLLYNPVVLFIDEIPSISNEVNWNALSFVQRYRKQNQQITFVAFQREIKMLFDQVINLRKSG